MRAVSAMLKKYIGLNFSPSINYSLEHCWANLSYRTALSDTILLLFCMKKFKTRQQHEQTVERAAEDPSGAKVARFPESQLYSVGRQRRSHRLRHDADDDDVILRRGGGGENNLAAADARRRQNGRLLRPS